ncbi:MAG: hypothetical protein C4567_10775 [Deltaproteobacteria bacterium]|nr:MAG: hypothetical protein C4567_10775 [Deltaproteobacteria bacterium]
MEPAGKPDPGPGPGLFKDPAGGQLRTQGRRFLAAALFFRGAAGDLERPRHRAGGRGGKPGPGRQTAVRTRSQDSLPQGGQPDEGGASGRQPERRPHRRHEHGHAGTDSRRRGHPQHGAHQKGLPPAAA